MAASIDRRPRRPRNADQTRADILAAAREAFSHRPFEQVGLREIAEAAGADRALVHRYFGSKAALFAAALDPQLGGAARYLAAEGPSFGARLAQVLLHPPTDPNGEPQLTALRISMQSASSPEARAVVREDIERRFVRPLAASLAETLGEGEAANLSAALIMAMFLGINFEFHVMRVEPLASTPMETLESEVAAVLDFIANRRGAS